MMDGLFFSEGDKKFLVRFGQELKDVFQKGDSIAIKLHMGEKYNPNHLQPDFVKKIVKMMKFLDFQPFLFDSPTMYEGPRHTAQGYKKQADDLGFNEANIGCPVITSDDFVEAKGKYMKYQVCRHLAEADGVLVLTHFKGHTLSGVGGAVKNLGMGALTSKSKADVHEGGKPKFKGKCALCKKCSEVCPQGCIRYDETGPVFDYEECYGCSKCAQICPNKCLKPRIAFFDELLADGASTAQKKFKKTYYVNVLRRIANVCDCSSKNLYIVCPDIGILMGRDACAIDHASIDMINRRVNKDLFLELWKKDPMRHVKEAEKLGMGSSEYEVHDA